MSAKGRTSVGNSSGKLRKQGNTNVTSQKVSQRERLQTLVQEGNFDSLIWDGDEEFRSRKQKGVTGTESQSETSKLSSIPDEDDNNTGVDTVTQWNLLLSNRKVRAKMAAAGEVRDNYLCKAARNAAVTVTTSGERGTVTDIDPAAVAPKKNEEDESKKERNLDKELALVDKTLNHLAAQVENDADSDADIDGVSKKKRDFNLEESLRALDYLPKGIDGWKYSAKGKAKKSHNNCTLSSLLIAQ